MNALPSIPDIAVDPEEGGRLAVLQRFTVEDIQHLGQAELLFAQSLAGHGDAWGRWQTPKSISPGLMPNCFRDIDLARRLRDYLAKEPTTPASLDALVDEGVLLLTRLALLIRLIGTRNRGYGRTQRLKPSSIAQHLYGSWPRIIARAIRRKTDDPDADGLLRCLIDTDVLEFNAIKQIRIQVSRLDTLVSRGVWTDAPPQPNITQTTDPSGKRRPKTPEEKPTPYPPIPDDYMAAIGPRVLWIVQEMGPHLLRLLETLPGFLQGVDWSLSSASISARVRRFVLEHKAQHPWQDDVGRPLVPTFPLTAASARGTQDINTMECPPRTWEHITNLSVTLQAAHLFITLLACAGRLGEVAMLGRSCVTVGRDGKDYLRGYTYKLSGNLFGDARQWPAPEILRHCLGQQVRLAVAWDWLPRSLDEDEPPQAPHFGDALWVSLGVAGSVGRENGRVNINQALMNLANRVDMNPKPGGKNLHAHRFRKTIGRLAGVALFNSPLALKRLFGHKSIEMTLHYILSDPGIREEAEKVLRELRIMHCAEALEEIHQALQSGQPLPGNGGPGAARLVTTVANEEEHLKQSGRVWGEGSAYDLAYLLTAQGRGWRLIKEHIVCSKAPGEDGLCQRKRAKGEPNTANCQPECHNRIVLVRQRRDTELVIAQYLDIARKAREDGQLLVLSGVMENLRGEFENFADLKEQYLADPEVQSLFALCDEPGDAEEAKVAA